MIIDSLVLTSAESNCHIVGDESALQAMVIDPGAEPDRISSRLRELDLKLALVVITHAHWDHVNAAGALSVQHGAPVAMHPADIPLLALVQEVTRDRTGQLGPEPPSISRQLADGDELAMGEVTLRVLHTPGHSPGSICLLGPGAVFSGDTLMAGWVGRTDRPGGSQEAIRASLWDRLLTLPDEMAVYAGHLEPTTIGAERRDNPYLNGKLPLR